MLKPRRNSLILLFIAKIIIFGAAGAEKENMSEVEKMLQSNPLFANMPMFQNMISENATSAGFTEGFTEGQRASMKRSSEREILSDNFGNEQFRRLNSSLFDSAEIEPNDIEFQFFRDMDQNQIHQPTGRHLSDDEDDLQSVISQEDSSTFSSTSDELTTTSTQPFTASESLFETTIAHVALPTTTQVPVPTIANSFARSSPYFQSFPTTTQSSTSTTNMVVRTEEDKFFIEENEIGNGDENGSQVEEQGEIEEEEEVSEGEESEDESIDDISTRNSLKNDEGVTRGLPRATFRGSSYMPLKPITGLTTKTPRLIRNGRKDENEVIQFNGKYSVSATKYYVDNRVDGEHYENPRSAQLHDNEIDRRNAPLINFGDGKRFVENFEPTDPFAIEKEVRKTARMRAHAAKTVNIDPIEVGESNDKEWDEFKTREDFKDYEYVDGEQPETHVKIEKKNGKDVETRETTYKGRKTTVKLWNTYLHGHDLLRYPGAVFDDSFVNNRGRDHHFASKLLLSNSNFQGTNEPPQNFNFGGENVKRVVAGVTNVEVAKRISPTRPLEVTDDIQSVCFNTQENTVVNNLSPFESFEDVSKLECLSICANSTKCFAVTFSNPLAVCAMYDGIVKENQIIRSQGHSYHKKLDRTTLKCLKMFSSRDFLKNFEGSKEWENSPTFLRLVEKDGQFNANNEENAIAPTAAADTSPLFPSTPKCPEGEDVIFVKSDLVERSDNRISRANNSQVEITEDDCVFACLTNTRPGGGKPLDCVAVEYDKRRGFCYLMQSFPGDVAMTPRPVNPVTLYEKICVEQSSSNQCSGGQPSRFRQKVLIGHLVDAHSVTTAAQCINLCITKKSIGCISAMFYSKETTLNCILNDTTHLDDPTSFYEETSTIVDYFSIADCLGIPEVERRQKRKRIEKMKRRMKKLKRLRRNS